MKPSSPSTILFTLLLVLSAVSSAWAVAEGQTRPRFNRADLVSSNTSADIARDPEASPHSLGTRPILAFDQGKCIESCDARYLSCAKGGDAARIKYCSDQHDQCRKGCLEHS